jgi:hypothetical protein
VIHQRTVSNTSARIFPKGGLRSFLSGLTTITWIDDKEPEKRWSA